MRKPLEISQVNHILVILRETRHGVRDFDLPLPPEHDLAGGLAGVARQVVERGTGPAERLDHVELVRAGPVVELLVFLLEVVGELDGEQELDADPRVAEELVIQQRPDERAHLAGIALDLLGFVDPIDQDDHAAVCGHRIGG